MVWILYYKLRRLVSVRKSDGLATWLANVLGNWPSAGEHLVEYRTRVLDESKVSFLPRKAVGHNHDKNLKGLSSGLGSSIS